MAMSFPKTGSLAALAMIAFSANSLLCRLALRSAGMDAASFTCARLVAGAAVLWLILRMRRNKRRLAGNWVSALALFVYAAGFSFAYARLPAAVGALILFGSVQVTMIGRGLWTHEKLKPWQIAGLCLASSGLVCMLFPGFSAPPLGQAALMGCAGAAWGVYSLRGKTSGDPAAATAGNFLRAVPFALLLSLATLAQFHLSTAGLWAAAASGAVASGLGYVVWYSVVPRLPATNAAIIQLSVPVLAALGGVCLLGEPITFRLLGSSVAILGGIALVISARR